LVRRDVLQQYGGFDVSLETLEDWDLWLKIAHEFPLAYVDKPLVNYRVHQASTTRDFKKTMHYHKLIIDKTFDAGGIGSGWPQLKPKALASSYGINSYVAEEGGDIKYAMYFAIEALKNEPLVLGRWKRLLAVLLAMARH
jgi:hypothetical protein